MFSECSFKKLGRYNIIYNFYGIDYLYFYIVWSTGQEAFIELDAIVEFWLLAVSI